MSTALAAFRALRLSISGGGPICWCLVLSRIGRPQFSAWVWPDVGDPRRFRHRNSGFEVQSDYGAASRNGLTSALENAANITLYRGHARAVRVSVSAASDHLLLAMNAICRCQADQKSDHGLRIDGNLANVGSKEGTPDNTFPGTADHTSAFANTTVEESGEPCWRGLFA
jgi:hypothetical protein